MRPPAPTRVRTALVAVLVLLTAFLAAPARGLALTGDDVVASNWIGLGYNQNPQPPNPATSWSAQDWATMQTRTAYISPGVVRVMFNLPWFWSGDDNTDHWSFDTSAQYANALQVVKYYVDKGVPVVSGLFGLQNLTYTKLHTAEVAAKLVRRLQDDGAAPTYWVGFNEPNVPDESGGHSFDDWVTATDNLVVAFAEKGVDTHRTTISGADTAEAGISVYSGDLNHQTATTCKTGTCPAGLVWKLANYSTMSATVFADTAADTSVTFQKSSDAVTWNELHVPVPQPVGTVTGKNAGGMFRYDYALGAITNAKYLRLSVATSAGEHTVGEVKLSNASTTIDDQLGDLTQTFASTGTWKDNGSWWLRSARQGALIGASDAHFYSQELYSAPPDYVLPVMTGAVAQLRSARPGTPILLGETGMKAAEVLDPETGELVKNYDFELEPEQALRMADLAVQEARAGVDGAAAWCLDGYAYETYCGMWGRGDEDPAHVSAHSTRLRPWFYTWSLLCRYLPTGSVIHAPAQPAGVRVLAAELPGGGWTIVLVNRTGSLQQVPVDEDTGSLLVHKYVFARDAEPKTDANGFPVPVGDAYRLDLTGGKTLSVGANTVVVITTRS
ncbi:hypothetical protein [Hamadaea tsunoensis]|uniref:hypothetical protein n=1 Tax=Hamadaea tsunoensis TaxID=53368 RepID=UPI0003F83788|nr:hypothetical protein [Hamadaea tsunoensis]